MSEPYQYGVVQKVDRSVADDPDLIKALCSTAARIFNETYQTSDARSEFLVSRFEDSAVIRTVGTRRNA